MKTFREFITESSTDLAAKTEEFKAKVEKATKWKGMTNIESWGSKIVFNGVNIPGKTLEFLISQNGDISVLTRIGVNFKTKEKDANTFFKSLRKEAEDHQVKLQTKIRRASGNSKLDLEDDEYELSKLLDAIDLII